MFMNMASENLTSFQTTESPRDTGELNFDDVLHHIAPAVIMAGKYVHIAWYGIGFLGNILSAHIWNVKTMYEVCSSAHYLVTISICDILCQILHIFYYLKIYWRHSVFDSQGMCEAWSVLFAIPVFISELLVLGFTIEKLIAIQNPLGSGWFKRNRRAPKEIIWIIVSVTAFAVSQAYFRKLGTKIGCNTDSVSNELAHPIWIWVPDIFMFFVVPCSVVILNVVIIRMSKRSYKMSIPRNPLHKEAHVRVRGSLKRSTIVLLRLSFFRVITLIPISVADFLKHFDFFQRSQLPPIYSINDVWSNERWHGYLIYSIVYHVIEIISSSRYALSFVIFVTSSPHFRRELKKLYWRKRQSVKSVINRTHYTSSMRAKSDNSSTISN